MSQDFFETNLKVWVDLKNKLGCWGSGLNWADGLDRADGGKLGLYWIGPIEADWAVGCWARAELLDMHGLGRWA
ncbi:hypothetical protein CRG98_033687 [Punica granatum]|uniref:Uncharacterized protein n=1 Tax=Punica granatum TaxID=22663 RepID=A0A2I0IPF8_PUNGR|nr:hypothetical protein CRG98_033687 [Punica granatum]